MKVFFTMNTDKGLNLLKRTVIALLAVVTVLYGLSGFGITQFRVVQTITFGILNKALAFKIHDALWIPFAILLILHLCLQLIFKSKKREGA